MRGFLHKPQNRMRGFLHRRLLRGFLLRGFLLRAHFVRVFFRLPSNCPEKLLRGYVFSSHICLSFYHQGYCPQGCCPFYDFFLRINSETKVRSLLICVSTVANLFDYVVFGFLLYCFVVVLPSHTIYWNTSLNAKFVLHNRRKHLNWFPIDQKTLNVFNDIILFHFLYYLFSTQRGWDFFPNCIRV